MEYETLALSKPQTFVLSFFLIYECILVKKALHQQNLVNLLNCEISVLPVLFRQAATGCHCPRLPPRVRRHPVQLVFLLEVRLEQPARFAHNVINRFSPKALTYNVTKIILTIAELSPKFSSESIFHVPVYRLLIRWFGFRQLTLLHCCPLLIFLGHTS